MLMLMTKPITVAREIEYANWPGLGLMYFHRDSGMASAAHVPLDRAGGGGFPEGMMELTKA